MIPYGKQFIEEDDIQAVVETLRADYLTTGPKVTEFEKTVAEYVGAKYAVAIANGTAALHAACFAAGIKKGDEVITTPLTFAASANCVLYCGGKPVFADVNQRTYNIDPEDIKRKITDQTKAIISVHLAGQPCDLDSIHKIAQEYDLIVIEDGAHALGAEYNGRKIGALSDMTTFSFHPVKPITTGEGGMIVTEDKEYYEKLCLFRNHGITRDRSQMTLEEGPWFYQQLELGFNYRITDFQCALGCTQMKKLDYFLKKRRALAERYDRAFRDNDQIVIPYQLSGTISGWHLYIVQVVGCDRKRVFEMMQAKGIGVNVHYIPVYYHPYYRENGYGKICCPIAEKLYNHFISIPLHPGMTEEQQDYIIDSLKESVKIFKTS